MALRKLTKETTESDLWEKLCELPGSRWFKCGGHFLRIAYSRRTKKWHSSVFRPRRDWSGEIRLNGSTVIGDFDSADAALQAAIVYESMIGSDDGERVCTPADIVKARREMAKSK